ncbi:MAG: translation initiation factor IF-1 [bacterium]|nr:MAG: translation initiation factor IF-1 [bacterium]
MKTNSDTYILEGTVTELLPNTMFRVVTAEGKSLLTTLKGKMRKAYVRVFPGDKVKVEMTKYDQDRGRIVFKYGK